MKAGMKKRKIFEDAVDLMTGEANGEDGVRIIPVDEVSAYHDHPFRLYTGERLEDMVESVRVNGILSPVIVREILSEGRGHCETAKSTDGKGMPDKKHRYEMLAGHNRMNAAKMAGLKEIPAIVKKNLSDEEAYIYVIETNVMQRSFAELLPSEKAAVMSEHYQKICGTMKKDEILLELGRLNEATTSKGHGGHDGRQTEAEADSGQDGHLAKTRDIVAAEYGFSSRNAARYLRINHLIRPFKDMIDDNKMALLAGVDISYLTEEEQELVRHVTNNRGWKIRPKMAAELRKRTGCLTDSMITEIFEGSEKKQDEGIRIRISDELRSRYFKGMETKEVLGIIDKALEAWFITHRSA